MATYVNNLRLKEIATGDESGTWGTSTNTNLELVTDGFSYGTKQMAADANETFTMPDATTDATRGFYLKITSASSLTATREVTLGPDTVSKVWLIENATSGSQIITIKQGSGATVNVASGSKVMLVTDGLGAGAAVINANPTEVGGTVTSVAVSGGTTGLTTSGGPVTGSGTITFAGTLAVANGGTGVTTKTGTGAVVLNSSPTFVTPTIDQINDANGLELIKFTSTSSAVNEITYANAATGGNPTITPSGDDSDIGLDIAPKGTGEVHVTSSFLTAIYSDKVNALGNTGTTQTITVTDGLLVTATLTDNCTFTLAGSNAIANRASSFTLILTNDATPSRTVAFAGGTVNYPGGSVTRTETASGVDVWVFFTPDGGTTWYSQISMKNVS